MNVSESMERIMKTRYTLFVLGVALLLIASCNREDISITYFKQLQSTSDNTNKEDSLMMPCGFIEYDSVRFSDGSYAVHRLQYAPQNSLTEFFDNKGRTIATVARASECYAQTLVYDYDDEGEVYQKDEIPFTTKPTKHIVWFLDEKSFDYIYSLDLLIYTPIIKKMSIIQNLIRNYCVHPFEFKYQNDDNYTVPNLQGVYQSEEKDDTLS